MGMARDWRKYGKTAALSAIGYVGDSRVFLFDALLRFLRVVLLLSLWRLVFQNRGVVSGMTLGSALTYAFVAEIFAEQMNCRSGLEDAFWEGTVVMRFLQPLGLIGQFAAEMTGRWLFGFLFFSLPLFLASPWLGVRPFPVSAAAAAFFAVSLSLAVAVGLALEFIFCVLMLHLDVGVWILNGLRNALRTLFSGAVIPFALLPWGLGAIFQWLPFGSMASAPLRIYTGTGDPARLIGLQLAWAAVLWPFALAFWRGSREKAVSYGG
jgi:ABC-2 type transport system permease protein